MSTNHDHNYYNHSMLVSVPGGFPKLLSVVSLVGALSACGASNNQIAQHARRVPIAHMTDLSEAARNSAFASLPLILEVRQGDRFPVEVLLESPLLELHTEGSWSLEATESFYVLLKKDGPPVLSADGIDFESQRGGSFSFGVAARQGEPPTVRLVLRMHGADQP